MSQPAAIFIDGGYLDNVLRSFGFPKIDYAKFVGNLLDNYHKSCDLFRVYYYHCLPYQSSPPTEEESRRFGNKQRFFDRLELSPNFTVKLGKLSYASNRNTFEQKEVDVMLAVDLVRLSMKKTIQHAIMITGDSDFLPAIRLAQDEGTQIILAYQPSGNNLANLRKHVDHRIEINEELIDSSLWGGK